MASRYTIINHLPPPAECLAILLGCAECIVFGLGGLSSPADYARGYGLPIDAPTEEGQELTDNQKTQKALVTALAARHVQNGVLILTLGLYTRERTALGFAVAYGVISTLADSFIVKSYGINHLAGAHVIGFLNSLVVGGALLCWRRDDKLW
ncbi:uncharacterized protein RCC_09737 [Ramularia collo-cygni]|uniref:DUF4267 domain-containing protein n=1 Tax=Ramularia collo-cygni TaxID=112498 RepID=A0A2D3VAP1_9PEZI|nr:uncharacterized protein RCC_09737 [Ramularia collo-cygni]CZT24020.1 uncharacterized protein RCC_09737 [Ramularia collo-cygni]